MKSLRKYVDNQRGLVNWIYNPWRENSLYEMLSTYFSCDIPNSILQQLPANSSRDFILECLRSTDYKFLLKEIDKKFSDKLVGFYELTDTNVTSVGLVLPKENISLKDNDEFIHVLHKYDYELSATNRLSNGNYEFLIEPIKPESKNDEVASKLHHGLFAYHVTSKDNVSKIKRTGLRPKTSNNRKYHPRVYLIIAITNVHDKIKSIINSVYGDENKCTILKIKLPLDSLTVYKDDTRTNDDFSYYTYSPILPQFIKEIKLSQLKDMKDR